MIIFSTFFLFSFRLNRIFQVHDMTINFSFVFAFFRSHGLSTSGNNDAIDGFPSWSITSRARIVLAFGLLVQSCLYHYCQQKVMAQKCFREMGNFWSTCPKSSIKVISKYRDLEILRFWSSRGFWQAWSCSKSWCIPNYQLSAPTKIYLFVCLIFEEFEK